MTHTITLINELGIHQTGQTVQAYLWQAGAPYYQTGITGYPISYSQVLAKGVYYAEITNGFKGTILVNGVILDGFVGIWITGEDEPMND